MLQETLLAAWRGLDRFEERALAARLAVPDRDQPVPERAARLRAPPQPPPSPGRAATAPEPTRRAEPLWLEPYPDALLDGLPDTAPGPGSPLRGQGGGRTGVHGRAAAPAAAAARGAGAARRARLPRRRGRRHARRQRGLGRTARCSGPGPRSTPSFPAASRDRAPVPRSPRERELVAGSRTRSRTATSAGSSQLLTDDALADHAARAAGVPGSRGDRPRSTRAGTWRRRPPRPARADPRQQPARVRLLPARPAGPVARAHGLIVLTLDGDQISRDHPVRRQQRVPPLRAAQDPARLEACPVCPHPPLQVRQPPGVPARSGRLRSHGWRL